MLLKYSNKLCFYFRMPCPQRNLTDEKILQIIMEDIPSASASEGEDSDTGDTDFAKTGDAAVKLSSSSDSDTEGPESNEDDCDSNKKVDAPKWKSNSMKASLEFSKSFDVPDEFKQVDDPTPLKIFDQLFSKKIIDHIVF